MFLCLLWFATTAGAQTLNGGRELKTVVIDPGHGGNDPGAVSAGIREKDIVLDVSLRLGKMISNAYPGVNVIYTRSKDVFIPLHTRASVAVKNKADLFISLHANWVSQTSVRGTETFTLGLHRSQDNLEVAKKENSVILLEEDYSTNYEGFNPNETESYIMFENMQSEYQSQSISLAAHIQDKFTGTLKLPDRGVKQAGFLVLRQITMPGVLVEIGFISNPTERKFLTSETGKSKVATSLFQAFSAYKKEIDSKSQFTMAGEEEHDTPKTGRTETETPKEGNSAQGTPPPAPKENHTPIPAAGNASSALVKAGKKEGSSNSPATWYAVQVGAVGKEVAPTPANFRGEKNIYKVRIAPFYKYYSGKYDTLSKAIAEKKRLSGKFPQAFVVIFENGVPRPLSKSELP